jgi:hypothetical protein
MAGTVPPDTTADAHARQSEIYRRLGGQGRVAVVYRLNQTVKSLALAGIRARHPGYSDTLVERAYTRMILGDAVVRAVWPDRELVDP